MYHQEQNILFDEQLLSACHVDGLYLLAMQITVHKCLQSNLDKNVVSDKIFGDYFNYAGSVIAVAFFCRSFIIYCRENTTNFTLLFVIKHYMKIFLFVEGILFLLHSTH